MNKTDPQANATSLAASLAPNAPATKYYCRYTSYYVDIVILDDEFFGEDEVEKPHWYDAVNVGNQQ